MEVQCGKGWACHSGASGLAGGSVVPGGVSSQGPDTVLLLSSPRLPPKPWSTPCLTVSHLSLTQGYKMDDLLTSYVQQLISTVNRQRGPRGSVSSPL